MEERDAEWERAHLIGWEWCGGGSQRLGESALVSGRGVEEGDTEWERARLVGGEWWGGGSHRLVEGALESEKNEWRRVTPTGRERTLEWKGMV